MISPVQLLKLTTTLSLVMCMNREELTGQTTIVGASECNSAIHNTSRVIRLLTIFPYPAHHDDSDSLQPSWDEGPAILSAAQLAVEHVNEDPNILPGYRLEPINVDGGCNIFSKALTNFVWHVHCGPPIAGVIGPGCSDSSLAVSSLLGRPEIALPNIHLAVSPKFENRARYPNSYGILGSSFTIIEATFSLINHNKWENIAILYDSTVFVQLSQQLRDFISHELQLGRIVFYSFVYDTYLPVDALIRSSARLIITFTSLTHAQKLLCIAHKRGMVFPRYQWVISGLDRREFFANGIAFHYSGVFYTCPNKLGILKDHLFVSYALDNDNDEVQLVSGYKYHEILQQYLHKVLNHNSESKVWPIISPSIWATITYDAVWALVLAISESLGDIIASGHTNTSSLPFGTEEFTNETIQKLDKIEFIGASGFIDFDNETGYTHRTVDIININSSMDANLVGFTDRGILVLTGDPQVFINTTITTRIEMVHPSVAVIFLLIILSLFLVILLLHILSTVKRKHPSIKASSPILNHFIFSGCYIWTAAAMIYILILKTLNYGDDKTYANCCHIVWVWLIPIGMTLTVGTLFARTWRVYRIFVHFRNPGRLLSNQVLIALVLIQLSFDIVIGAACRAVSPMRVWDINRELIKENNVVTHTTERSCVFTSNYGISYLFWIIILYSYKVLQILSLFTLSLLARNITNRKFATFLLRRASYLIFALYVSLLPTFTLLWYKHAEIHTDFVIMCILIGSTMSVCLVFVLLPPAIPILKELCITLFGNWSRKSL